MCFSLFPVPFSSWSYRMFGYAGGRCDCLQGFGGSKCQLRKRKINFVAENRGKAWYIYFTRTKHTHSCNMCTYILLKIYNDNPCLHAHMKQLSLSLNFLLVGRWWIIKNFSLKKKHLVFYECNLSLKCYISPTVWFNGNNICFTMVRGSHSRAYVRMSQSKCLILWQTRRTQYWRKYGVHTYKLWVFGGEYLFMTAHWARWGISGGWNVNSFCETRNKYWNFVSQSSSLYANDAWNFCSKLCRVLPSELLDKTGLERERGREVKSSKKKV